MKSHRKKVTQAETPRLLHSAHDYFHEAVTAALEQTGVRTIPQVQGYLTDLLQFYMSTANLFDEHDSKGRLTRETLAELYLKAHNSEFPERFNLLKRLGDRSLYISGFFSDSLQRKLVDVDYYIEMGGVAYADLAEVAREDSNSRIFREFSKRFLEFVEVLNVIAQTAHVQNEENILRLLDLYAQTGSQVLREQLLQKGIIAIPPDSIKKNKV